MKQFLLSIILLASSLFAQQVPPEVQKMIDGYIKDSTADFGFIIAKRNLGIDQSLQLADIRVGRPIEVYHIRYSLLDTCGNDLPVRDFTNSSNIWIFPVQARGKFIYDIEIAKWKDGKWHWTASNGLSQESWWSKLRKAYPESSTVQPILIRDGVREYLHFPQKSAFNLFMIKHGNEQDTFSLHSSNSIDSLDDSRRFLSYQIERWKQDKPNRDAINKRHPGFFADTGNERSGK